MGPPARHQVHGRGVVNAVRGVGTRGRVRGALCTAGGRRAMERDPQRAGWWTRARRRPRDGDAVRLRAGRRPRAARPALAPPAGRPRRAERGRRPRARTRGAPRGPGAALPGAVLYELHVGTYTPEGTLDAAAERLGHLVELGVTHVELMPLCPFPGTARLGVRGGLAVGGARAVRRPRGAEAVRRRGARAGPRRRPGRGPQPPRPLRQLPARVRPVLHRHPPHALGRRRSTWTRPARTRCARICWAARWPGCGTTGSTGCAWTPCTRWRDTRACHFLEELSDGRRRAGRRARPAAVPDRRVRPERPADRSPRARRAASGCTPSGTTTSTTPCTPR